VNVSQDDGRIVLTAPLPGLEAQNISITVEGKARDDYGDEAGPG
jgi:HSP20 family molecular chaperone IbpA